MNLPHPTLAEIEQTLAYIVWGGFVLFLVGCVVTSLLWVVDRLRSTNLDFYRGVAIVGGYLALYMTAAYFTGKGVVSLFNATEYTKGVEK